MLVRQDLLKILYIDSSLHYLKDVDQGTRENVDKTDPSYDCKNGVRCLKISPDGKQLASGDRQGNIRWVTASGTEQGRAAKQPPRVCNT